MEARLAVHDGGRAHRAWQRMDSSHEAEAGLIARDGGWARCARWRLGSHMEARFTARDEGWAHRVRRRLGSQREMKDRLTQGGWTHRARWATGLEHKTGLPTSQAMLVANLSPVRLVSSLVVRDWLPA